MSQDEKNPIPIVPVEQLYAKILKNAPDNVSMSDPEQAKKWIANELAMLTNFIQVTMNQVMGVMAETVHEMALEVDKEIKKQILEAKHASINPENQTTDKKHTERGSC